MSFVPLASDFVGLIENLCHIPRVDRFPILLVDHFSLMQFLINSTSLHRIVTLGPSLILNHFETVILPILLQLNFDFILDQIISVTTLMFPLILYQPNQSLPKQIPLALLQTLLTFNQLSPTFVHFLQLSSFD